MQQSRSIQNIRRIAMMIGFALFALCIYKAGHEVASPKIAAGVQRTQGVGNNSNILAQLGIGMPTYDTSASASPIATTTNEHVNSSTATIPTMESSNKQSKPRGATKVNKHITPSHSAKSSE